METLLLVYNRDNVVAEIIKCESVAELENKFGEEITGYGIEPTDNDYDNGYFEFEDGLTICMKTV